MGLRDIFGTTSFASDGPQGFIPYDKRDIIPLANGEGRTNAVNFNYILHTGKVPAQEENYSVPNQYIDWDANDLFVQTLGVIENRALRSIEKSENMQKLLKKEHWGSADRTAWERGVSKIVSDEVGRIRGLDDARDNYDGRRRSPRLNDLGIDIDNPATRKIAFGCEGMAVVEGVLNQRIENLLLPKKTADTFDYKRAGNYYFMTGSFSYDRVPIAGKHAFIVTPNGNVIESTARPSQPLLSSYGEVGYTGALSKLSLFVDGKTLLASELQKGIYGSYKQADHDAVRRSKNPPTVTWSRDELLAQQEHPGVSTLESPDGKWIALARRGSDKGVEYRSMEIYSAPRQSEAFTNVTQADFSGPVKMLDIRGYKFSVSMSGSETRLSMSRDGNIIASADRSYHTGLQGSLIDTKDSALASFSKMLNELTGTAVSAQESFNNSAVAAATDRKTVEPSVTPSRLELKTP